MQVELQKDFILYELQHQKTLLNEIYGMILQKINLSLMIEVIGMKSDEVREQNMLILIFLWFEVDDEQEQIIQIQTLGEIEVDDDEVDIFINQDI